MSYLSNFNVHNLLQRTIILILITSTFIACSHQPGENPLLPSEAIKSRLSGLNCNWTRDSQSFLHVTSENDLSTFACMGYAHAKDRAWMMDYHRRITQGRTSELHGKSKMKMDFMMRLLGVYERAEKIYEDLEKNDFDSTLWLWAYSYGVNKHFSEIKKTDVYEFEKLNYLPALWSPVDSIALLLLQSFDQTRQTFLRELEEEKLAIKWGKEKANLFNDEGLPWENTILKKGEYPISNTVQIKQNDYNFDFNTQNPKLILAKELNYDSISPLFENTETGSNNWVLAPKKSKAGFALFANDPHLSLRYPPFWHWIQLQTPEWKAMGASFPGIPSIASGFNNNAAWGVTNSYLDTARIASVNEDRLIKNTKIRPTVWVKYLGIKWPIFFKTFERTAEGYPVLPFETSPGRKLVLYWTGFETSWKNMAALRHVLSSKSAKEILNHLANANIPSWNFVAADINGNIGYQATGSVIKHSTTPVFGYTELTNDQSIKPELLAADQNPNLFNPIRGFIATANHRHWPADSQWHGGTSYRSSFRGFRIEELITQTEKHDFDSMKNIICDYQAVDARFLTSKIIENLDITSNPEIMTGVEALKNWDFNSNLECHACGLYRRTVDLLLSQLGYEDQPTNIPFLYRWLSSEHSPEKTAQVTQSFLEALKQVSSSKTELKKWSEIHRNYFRHLSDDETFKNENWIPTPGDDNSVSPGTNDWRNGYFEHTNGASQRLMVELNPKGVRGIMILPGPNQDLPNKDLSSESSPFSKWRNCSFENVEFNISWENSKTQTVSF